MEEDLLARGEAAPTASAPSLSEDYNKEKEQRIKAELKNQLLEQELR